MKEFFKKLNLIKKIFSNGVNKKSILYLGTIFLVVFLVVGFIWYFFIVLEKKEIELTQEEIIKRQLEELAQLRADNKVLTEEEIKEQLKELEQLRQDVKPLTEEERQQQLEELEKLRNQ